MTSDDRPLILFVAPYFAPACHGGVVQIYMGLLTRLKRYRVVVVADMVNTTEEAAKAWDAAAWQQHGFTVERIGAFEFHMRAKGWLHRLGPIGNALGLLQFLMKGRRQWAELLRRYKPDGVICGGTYSAGWLMGSLPRHTALINYIHGEELTMQVKPRMLMPWMRRWQFRCLERADMNLSVSSYSDHLIRQLTHAPVETLRILPNFIDLERFHISGRREELQAKYGWTGRTVLLTVARLEKRKGIDQVLRALALLKQQEKLPESWRYAIGGRGAEQKRLAQLVSDLDLASSVEFLGFVPEEDLAGLYEAADVFVQPNREIDGDTEGFGVVFLEANACGLPVIGGEAGGTADAIDNGRTGFRVNGDSVHEIADAIAILMENCELRLRLSQQGMEWASNFDVNQAVLRFEDLLDEAMHHHRLAEALTSVSADI